MADKSTYVPAPPESATISKTLKVAKAVTNTLEYIFPERFVDAIGSLGQRMIGGEKVGVNIVRRLENAAFAHAVEKVQKRARKTLGYEWNTYQEDELGSYGTRKLTELASNPKDVELYKQHRISLEAIAQEHIVIKCLDPAFLLSKKQQQAILSAVALQLPVDMIKTLTEGCYQGLDAPVVLQLARSWYDGGIEKNAWMELYHTALGLGLDAQTVYELDKGLATGMYGPEWVSECMRQGLDADQIANRVMTDRNASLEIVNIDLATEKETKTKADMYDVYGFEGIYWYHDSQQASYIECCNKERRAFYAINIRTTSGTLRKGERIVIGNEDFTVTEIDEDGTARAVSEDSLEGKVFYKLEKTERETGPYGDYTSIEYSHNGQIIYGHSDYGPENLWYAEHGMGESPSITYENSDLKQELETELLPDLRLKLVEQCIRFTGMDVLSAKDFKELKGLVPECGEPCWLQTSGNTNRGAYGYSLGRNIGATDNPAERYGVRPQLFFDAKSVHLPVGTVLSLPVNGQDTLFSVIEPGRMIAAAPIAYTAFNEIGSNNTEYAQSLVKKLIDESFENLKRSIGRDAQPKVYEVAAMISQNTDSIGERTEIRITGADIITMSEYKAAKDIIPKVHGKWMTRTIEETEEGKRICSVDDYYGTIDREDGWTTGYQRPIVTFESDKDIPVGSKVQVNDTNFTVIGPGRMITDEVPFYSSFDGARFAVSFTFAGSELECNLNEWFNETFGEKEHVQELSNDKQADNKQKPEIDEQETDNIEH